MKQIINITMLIALGVITLMSSQTLLAQAPIDQYSIAEHSFNCDRDHHQYHRHHRCDCPIHGRQEPGRFNRNSSIKPPRKIEYYRYPEGPLDEYIIQRSKCICYPSSGIIYGSCIPRHSRNGGLPYEI